MGEDFPYIKQSINLLSVGFGLGYLVCDIETSNPVIAGCIMVIQLAEKVDRVTIGQRLDWDGGSVLLVNNISIGNTVKAIYERNKVESSIIMKSTVCTSMHTCHACTAEKYQSYKVHVSRSCIDDNTV